MSKPQDSLWGGRFQGRVHPSIAAFNRSFDFDRALFGSDVTASRAWARALRGAGVLAADEMSALEKAFAELLTKASDDTFLRDANVEDVHSFLESRLAELTGDTARRVHTGRSRNDQVATAFRLWTRDAVDALLPEVRKTQAALLTLADKAPLAPMPGYTHLQRAQPVLFAHWCLAYFEMLERDAGRLRDLRPRLNVMPLGSGALAGTSQNVDRAAIAQELGFGGITRNSLDAVSDRDFALELCAAGSILMVHLSRVAEDVILYASQEFGFFDLSDAISTGSSLMPQKKNPDPMELVRGKSGRVFGHLTGLLAAMKGLPLAYNKDMQEDKEALFDTVATLRVCLEATSVTLQELTPKPERMREAATRGYLNATELADYLVRKGVPFRYAHDTAGKIVLEAVKRGVEIDALPLDAIRVHAPQADADVFEALSLERTLASKNVPGGTAPNRVSEALAEAKKALNKIS
jgi:argininosuccinate lyase